MKRWVSYALTGLAGAIFFIGCALILHCSDLSLAQTTCGSISTHFTDTLGFVTDDDVKKWISEGYGDCIGQNVDDIRLHEIEALIESKSAVRTAEAWICSDGVLNVSISQREPVMRFIYPDGSGFQVDDRGGIFPLHRSYKADVLEVCGEIPFSVSPGYTGRAENEKDALWISRMLALQHYIEASPEWKNRVCGIHVRKDGDLVLSMAEADEKFIFGGPVELEGKFDGISKYYSYIRPEKGENFYKSVNVKYNGQIICRKDM